MKTLPLVLLFVLLALPARATPITWTLQDVTLEDGGMLTGGFTFDDALGLDGLSSVNIVATGYVAPHNITPTTFSTVEFSEGSGIIGIYSVNNNAASFSGCYADEIFQSNPCTVLSAFDMSLSEPLGSANQIAIAGGMFRMECATIVCPEQKFGFPLYDNITSGYICSETPCPGGPAVSVPEPSSLESILMGFFMIVMWVGKKFKIDIGL